MANVVLDIAQKELGRKIEYREIYTPVDPKTLEGSIEWIGLVIPKMDEAIVVVEALLKEKCIISPTGLGKYTIIARKET